MITGRNDSFNFYIYIFVLNRHYFILELFYYLCSLVFAEILSVRTILIFIFITVNDFFNTYGLVKSFSKLHSIIIE